MLWVGSVEISNETCAMLRQLDDLENFVDLQQVVSLVTLTVTGFDIKMDEAVACNSDGHILWHSLIRKWSVRVETGLLRWREFHRHNPLKHYKLSALGR